MLKPFIFAIVFMLTSASSEVFAQPEASAKSKTDEIQVMIDVSGSMKQNDPENLRVEASRLLINLLPDSAKAKLWLFAEKTTPLAATDAVTSEWKRQATKASADIHSRGLYTHIEEAIKTALEKGFADGGNKHLILLTDGFVDISKDIMISADSRERILSEWLPKLQQQNIKVHTVALSGQADKDLLEQLARDTGGWTELAQSAGELQKAFLKMAQKAAPKETLPLTDNRFLVDAGIKEFSALVFKKPHASATQLVMPDGKNIGKQSMAGNISWLDGQGYDLITVREPLKGEWQLLADIDPDNQVMIVTDLKLELNGIPNSIGEQEPVNLKAHFTEKGQLLTRADFLGLVNMQFVLDQQPPIKLQADNKSGYFQHQLKGLAPGKHVLKVIADGKTFKREILHEVQVIVSGPILVEKSVDDVHRKVTLALVPGKNVTDTGLTAASAVITRDDMPPKTEEVHVAEGRWQLELSDLPPGSSTRVSFNALAKDVQGKPVTPAIPAQVIDDSWFNDAAVPATSEAPPPVEDHPVEAPAHSAAPEQVTETPATHDKQPIADEHSATEASEENPGPSESAETNWLAVGGALFLVNLLLGGGGFFAYRHLQRTQAEQHRQLLEKLA